jgi:4-hydroxythreonine-4-phosphate dehydrogenase
LPTSFIPRLVISAGEPAGIGPDIIILAAQQAWAAELIVVADPDLIMQRAKQIGATIQLQTFTANAIATAIPQHIKIIPIKLKNNCISGKLDIKNASYVLECLQKATDLCMELPHSALVTGPIQKSIINEANIPFSGHTEFLQNYTQAQQVLMLFVTQTTKVALVTTHIPLASVASAITAKKIESALTLLHKELINQFNIDKPKIIVTGLNPHAGESGHIGREEIEIIEPTLKRLRSIGMDIIGPLPADTVFTPQHLSKAHAILAMYHDQALPAVKQMSFGHAVNVTLGLPIIRTSVDHGTALDLAGTGKADVASLNAAIETAINMVNFKSKKMSYQA